MEQKPKIDPGWNDPPVLNYSASNPPPKSRITNKRVAFPLSNSTSTKSETTSGLPPPILPPRGPPPSATSILQPQQSSSLNDTKDTLNKFIRSEEDKLLFSKDWDEGKFSIECKKLIDLFAKLLAENDKMAANELRVKLTSEYKHSCEQWLNSIEL
ncbi:hypothetical protein JTB14_003663 [Gonioctena quinquepunctata]|nr:hypothetical protein JTB14_003663 [Gonioctena quinquepunctata]